MDLPDITIIYVTSNTISNNFRDSIIDVMLKGIGNASVISVSKKPMDLGFNIVCPNERSHVGIYRDALVGAKAAKTKYVGFAEDDVLYSPDHFKKRPSSGKFAYNVACWSLFTWHEPPTFNYTGRRNLGQLICERDLFIEAMEERFKKYPEEKMVDNRYWAEPSKYERQLGVTIRDAELFYTDPPNVMFSHFEGLSYHTIGERKRLAPIRAYEIPYWKRAEDVIKIYEKNTINTR